MPFQFAANPLPFFTFYHSLLRRCLTKQRIVSSTRSHLPSDHHNRLPLYQSRILRDDSTSTYQKQWHGGGALLRAGAMLKLDVDDVAQAMYLFDTLADTRTLWNAPPAYLSPEAMLTLRSSGTKRCDYYDCEDQAQICRRSATTGTGITEYYGQRYCASLAEPIRRYRYVLTKKPESLSLLRAHCFPSLAN